MLKVEATISFGGHTENNEPEVSVREKLVTEVKEKLIRVLHLLAPLDDILGTHHRLCNARAGLEDALRFVLPFLLPGAELISRFTRR